MGMIWTDGMQNQQTPIQWMNSATVISLDSDRLTPLGADGQTRTQIWPDTTTGVDGNALCHVKDTKGETGYWQLGGYHAFIPGMSIDTTVFSNLKIYNGLTQDDTDRMQKNISHMQGYNDESNIARAATVVMRLIDDKGRIATIQLENINANSARGWLSSDLLTRARTAYGPEFGGANGKFAAEIFVGNDPKSVHIYATKRMSDGSDPIALPVYTDMSETTAIVTGNARADGDRPTNLDHFDNPLTFQ